MQWFSPLVNATEELVNKVNYSDFNLIVKHHVVDSNKEQIYTDSRMNMAEGETFTAMDFMCAADYVVTDYSSVIYEALLKDLPIYIFCFDSDKYIDERGFYIDFWTDLPALYSKNAKGICDFIASGMRANRDKEEKFKKAYVNKRFDSITAQYGKLIDELARGVYDGRYNYGVISGDVQPQKEPETVMEDNHAEETPDDTADNTETAVNEEETDNEQD